LTSRKASGRAEFAKVSSAAGKYPLKTGGEEIESQEGEYASGDITGILRAGSSQKTEAFVLGMTPRPNMKTDLFLSLGILVTD
jgi:hypothetical protein